MKIVQINLGLYGSTGKVMLGIEKISKVDIEFVFVYPDLPINTKGRKGDILIKGIISRKVNHFLEKTTGFQGIFSIFKTLSIVDKIKKENPNIIHLHNIHGMNINYPLLFRYFKKSNVKIIWTLHDCWSFTGQCPHFTLIKCDKWKNGCFNCPQYKEYPEAYVDRTKTMWNLKKKWFTSLDNLTIVTPSKWLAGLVRSSYLNKYKIEVINNGIDLSVFRPTESDFKNRYNIYDKYIVLGVSFTWGIKKGLDVFINLSKKLDDRFVIVLVGLDIADCDNLPSNIIPIIKTSNQNELAKIYTISDVFVNPTREENYPTVNMEALSCGTPTITFDTGGSPEIVDEKCGRVVPCDDLNQLYDEIVDITVNKTICTEDCIKKSKEFNIQKRYEEYIELYKETY